ncbi:MULTISPECIES: Lar family restriction alleviation protein [Acetobacter]|uniref:Lar family restriction alleviation protein n=1 Tax=Acetobacter TaxID=434 RepID=UPI0039EC8984
MRDKADLCPTCKGSHIAIKRSLACGISFYAECKDCEERGPREHTVEAAKSAWNTRAGEKA